MAYRNVWRNGYRTAITVFAIGFSGAVMIFYSTLMTGLRSMMETNAVEMNMGRIQLHAPGYRLDADLYNQIQDVPSLIARLEKNQFHAAPRLYGGGLAAFQIHASGVTLRGIDVVRESNVTQLYRHIKSGAWLSVGQPEGVPLQNEVVIGSKLARALSVEVGQEIVIVSQATDGAMANDIFRVRGILKASSEEIDRFGVFMKEPTFRAFLSIDSGVHEIAIQPKDSTLDIKQATAQIALIAPGVEVKNWRELQPAIAHILEMNQIIFIIIMLLAYLAAASTVLNAVLMSVFERMPEFGMMKAMGVTPRQIVGLIFMEEMMKTATAVLLAIALGLPIALHTERHGIDLSMLMKGATISGIAFDPILYPKITVTAIMTPIALLVCVVAVAVIYPGVKEAVIKPLDALNHI
jgi:ABC-type lipoprotein release transport system permease subunit